MKIMGLDFGSRTCGVSMSDSLLITAQPAEIIRRQREKSLRRTLARLEELIAENDVRLIVLGLPLNMNDTSGARVEATQSFREQLVRRTGLPVVWSDERLTTVEAIEMMDRMGIAVNDREQYVDMIASNIILQEYLENHREELQAMLQ